MRYVCEICGVQLEGSRRKLCPECAKNPWKSTRIKEKDKIKKTKGYADRDVLASKGNTKQCCTCEYWDNLHLLCDYYSKTGQLRLCDESPNCKKYKREMKINDNNESFSNGRSGIQESKNNEAYT